MLRPSLPGRTNQPPSVSVAPFPTPAYRPTNQHPTQNWTHPMLTENRTTTTTTTAVATLDPEERQRLLLENLPEVRYIARRIHDRLPSHVPFDDLVHAGILGLIDAVDKFDPSRNVQLKSYARFRIRGAILDSLRHLDWSPRALRRQARRIEDTQRELATTLGRAPNETEI